MNGCIGSPEIAALSVCETEGARKTEIMPPKIPTLKPSPLQEHEIFIGSE